MTDERWLRRRTIVSFAVLILGGGLLFGGWSFLTSTADDEDIAPILRRALEWNGRLWSPPSERQDRRPAPQARRLPRVNGDIGLSSVDPDKWRLQVVENADAPGSRHFELSLRDLEALPRTETSTEFRCIEGWSENMAFAGVKFTDFMKAYHLEPKRYVGLVSVDGEYYVSVDIESMRHAQTLLAYEVNGMPLPAANGAPLRLVIPIKYGIKNLKQIGKIFFSDTRPPDYWAERGYDWFAGL